MRKIKRLKKWERETDTCKDRQAEKQINMKRLEVTHAKKSRKILSKNREAKKNLK